MDASLAEDAGTPAPHDGGWALDGGGALDAGVPSDAGATFDAGPPPDGGTTLDAGTTPDAGAPRPTGPFPRNGWPSPTAHNGRVVPWDLSQLDEDTLLLAGGRAALYAVGGGPDDHHEDREPLVFVHGINGEPANLQSLVDRFWSSRRYQIYVLAFNDFNRRTYLNGEDFAEDLRALAAHVGRAAPVTIVAHSLGGIVTRWAMNRLSAAAPPQGLDRFGTIRVFGVDNPWHGYDGPEDGPLMDVARVFMPDGLEDMRALSGIFLGDHTSADPVLRDGLSRAVLGASVQIHPSFAEAGDTVLDYTEGVNAELPQRIATAYLNGNPVQGEAKQLNFWEALRSAAPFAAFDAELRAMGGRLDAVAVQGALLRHYPRFPGDHTSVLAEHPSQPSLLDHLAAALQP